MIWKNKFFDKIFQFFDQNLSIFRPKFVNFSTTIFFPPTFCFFDIVYQTPAFPPEKIFVTKKRLWPNLAIFLPLFRFWSKLSFFAKFF